MKTKFFNLPKPLLLLISIIITALIGVIDYVTTPENAIFYLLPIFLASWTRNVRAGVLISTLCAILWLVDDIVKSPLPYGSQVHYWDATVRYGFFLIFSFTMSRLKRALDEEKQLSRTDTVTKIANGRLFLEMTDAELQKLRRYNHAFTVAYMDLDNFKEVNDRFGHNAGDELLRLVAETLRKNIRSADVVARLGGDEFGVLFPETDNGPAHVVVNKLLRGLKAAARESACPVTFSIGVMTFKNAPASLNEVIKLADDIMYSVKSSGKNNVRFETWSIKEKAGIP